MYSAIFVDDEIAMIECLEYTVDWKSYGINIDGIFEDAVSALDYVSKNNVDVIFTDIKMPNISGLELINQVRAINRNITVIVISAYGDFKYTKEAIKQGVYDYLLKPIDFDELEQMLENLQKRLNSRKFFTSTDISSVFSQRVFNDFLSEKGCPPDEVVKLFKDFNIPVDIETSPIALIRIEIEDFSEYISSTWEYGIDRLYSCIMGIITIDDVSVFMLNSAFGIIEFIAVAASYIAFSEMENKIKKSLQKLKKDAKENLMLDLSASVLRIFDNIFSAQMYADGFISIPKYKSIPINNIDAISKALTYIDRNYMNDISLNEISEYASFSPYHFSRSFKKSVGMNFSDYLNKYRIEKARYLLETSNESIATISLKVGYRSKNHFYKMFRLFFGCSPKEYREKLYYEEQEK